MVGALPEGGEAADPPLVAALPPLAGSPEGQPPRWRLHAARVSSRPLARPLRRHF